MTAREHQQLLVKLWREFAERPKGKIDTEGKMIMLVRAQIYTQCANQLEESLRKR